MLREHQDRGELVFYAAPRFHTAEELNDHFVATRVLHHSALFRPLDVGVLDQEAHFVAYHQTGARDWWVFSEPIQRDIDIWSESFTNEVLEAVAEAETRPTALVLNAVIRSLTDLADFGRVRIRGLDQGAMAEDDQISELLRVSGELAQLVLGSQLILITEANDRVAAHRAADRNE